MMLFKDLITNSTLYVLNTDTVEISTGKVLSVSLPRVNTSPTHITETVVDVTLEVNGQSNVYTIPSQLSTAYTGSKVLATDQSLLLSEVETIIHKAEQAIASVEKNKEILEKAKALLPQLNPIFKERQENERRMASLENSIGELKSVVEKQSQMLMKLLNNNQTS